MYYTKYIISLKKNWLKYTIILRETILPYWPVRKPALVKLQWTRRRPRLKSHARVRKQRSWVEQSLVLQSSDERAQDYGPRRAHSSRLHGHSQVCWTAIADAKRPFRPWWGWDMREHVLGPCGRWRWYSQKARCQSTNIDISIPKLTLFM